MKFRGVLENSSFREIGNMFRPLNGSDWHINVKLAPHQRKRYFGISQLPVLARRRMINADDEIAPAGFTKRVAIKNTRNWKAEPIKTCPIAAVRRQEDAQQWCFVFENNGITFYLPQLELARALFFHFSYLARLSLVQSGFDLEFDIQKTIGVDGVLINILPTCTLPLYVRQDPALRRVLFWIMLDTDARQSFESINQYQLQYGYDTKKYRLWRFQFDPPLLNGSSLTLRGHYHKGLKAIFVYEIDGVTNLTCDCPANVEFDDPLYNDKQSDHIYPARPEASSIPDLKIDDDQEPDSDKTEMRIEIPAVIFEFANPFQVTRKGKGQKGARGGRAIEKGYSVSSLSKTDLAVSTDEASLHGTLPYADFDGIEDESDDAHLYAYKFEAFESMVEQLVNRHSCILQRREIRKFVSVAGCSKHLLADGTPRYISFHFIKKDASSYTLLEVDTSDNINRLSTLLLRQVEPPLAWSHKLGELEVRLLKGSLVWPTFFLAQVFGSDFKRIKHPRTSLSNKALLEQESIHHWADRVYSHLSVF
jgi:hypothetical protein